MCRLPSASRSPKVREIDAGVAADLALEILVDSAWRFVRQCKALPPEVIRGLLGRTPTDASHIYLALAVDTDLEDAALAKSWARAIQGLDDLELGKGWKSTPKREKFRALAKNKHLLPAIQGAAARGVNVSNDMLAVLVTDGSAESLDALIPHLDSAGLGDRLDALRLLRVHAKNTPALRAVFAELDREAEKAGSPALAIARLIGFPDAKEFWFDSSIGANQAGTKQATVLTARIKVDSRTTVWFEVHVSTLSQQLADIVGGTTSFSHAHANGDELELGRCDAKDLPRWLARVATKLGVDWVTPYIRTSLRGPKRDQIARWLVPRPAGPIR